MTKSTPLIRTHIGDPKLTPHIDHEVIAVEVDNCHKFALKCKTCDKQVKWSTELDYLWLKYVKNNKASFRTLWWASRYDTDYQVLARQLQDEKWGQEIQQQNPNKMISLEQGGFL